VIENHITENRELAIQTCVGTISVDDILQAAKALHEGGAPKNCIWDFREADVAEMQTDHVESLARTIKQVIPDEAAGKTAIVVGGDLGFGLGRVYEAYAGIVNQPEDIMVFRTIEDAHEWMKV
jgi:hypothetical protein